MIRIPTFLVVLFALIICGPAFAQGGPGGRGPGPRGEFGPPGRPRPDRDRDRDRDGQNNPDDLDDSRPRPGRLSPDAQRDLDAFWDNNKDKIIEFCKKYSPNRWSLFERRIGQVKDYRAPRIPMLLQFKHLIELEKSDPELFKIKVAQIQVEDEEYRYAREVNRAMGGDVEKEARRNLRRLGAEAVKLRLDEREMRLARLQKRLHDEQQRLARDRANSDALVDAHVEDAIRVPPGPSPRQRQATTSQPHGNQTGGPGTPN
jgi:hypothetical protein